MLRFSGRSTLLAVVLVVPGTSARAQYHYPGGYGSYGWGGWGGAGSTVAGSTAYGMGNFAAGAGTYNEQTAQARSMNANTAMQVNNYMYQVNQRNAANEMAKLSRRRGAVNEAAADTYKRLHDNPDAYDIHTGSALNVVLDELTNPKVYTQVVQKATQPIDSQLVKNIVFQNAPNMVAISLDNLSARGVPDALATDPAFEADRRAIRALVAKAKQEAEGKYQVSIETLREARTAIKALQEKVAKAYPQGTKNRDQSDNFLKALYGLTKMLEDPNVEQFLKGLDRYPTTTLGHLITFMYSFGLRFGAAKTPIQEATYDQLYPILVGLRDGSNAQGPNPITAQAPEPDPKPLTNFFSGMDYSHFQPQPKPTSPPSPPPPPSPGERDVMTVMAGSVTWTSRGTYSIRNPGAGPGPSMYLFGPVVPRAAPGR